MLNEHRSKLGETEVTNVETALASAKEAIKEGGLDKIRAANDQLTQASHKLAEAMYAASAQQPGQPGGDSQSGAPGGSAGGAGEKKADENVVDAEFVDVEDRK